MTPLDRTHDPAAGAWLDSARTTDADFPVQNLPFGIFRDGGEGEPRVGVAIGDRILDLARAGADGLLAGLSDDLRAAAGARTLNPLMALGSEVARALRHRLFDLLVDPEAAARVRPCLAAASRAELLLPAEVGDYTDFYASVHHATNVGSMFRPDNPLLPNYRHVPIGYHGRASSVVVSGTPVRRPSGQTLPDGAADPAFGPTRALDYECEVALWVGTGNALGTPVPVAEAGRHLFGVSLLNDWSARDVQRWEYQPLGPFLAKNFATSVSPWVVTMDALAPFRAPAAARAEGEPRALPYLTDPADQAAGALGLSLEVTLASARMRDAGLAPVRLSLASFASLYWTPAQLLAHHASNGCNLRPGDLLGSGTVSGPDPGSRGCLLELTWRGSQPVTLPTGEVRRFLEDGDEVTLRGWCEREGFRRIGLGECRGVVLPAVAP
jgi:fumarylacetoacetase